MESLNYPVPSDNHILSKINENNSKIQTAINTFEQSYLTASKTVYVTTTGNDTTGDGASGNPYATVTKALSVIPKNLNGFTANVNIGAGAYSENLVINGFNGGLLSFELVGGESTTLNGKISLETVQRFKINSSTTSTLNINKSTSGNLFESYGSNSEITNVNIILSGSSLTNGLYISNNSEIFSTSAITIYNCYYALATLRHSSVCVQGFGGSGNLTGIIGSYGSIISYGTKTISATTEKILDSSSIITNLLTMS